MNAVIVLIVLAVIAVALLAVEVAHRLDDRPKNVAPSRLARLGLLVWAGVTLVARLVALLMWGAAVAVEGVARLAEASDRGLADWHGVKPYAGRVEAWLIPDASPWAPRTGREGARRG